ncbi:helix-turn-helix domain-containing protein [Actinomadura chokoriensis]|uniref:Helix-turn-helix domain-containing protein n=1 Tax=Actinomadura chokoriensis TaxID=454156 RepID=A0ABV4R3B5_9ACTN
MTTGFQTGPVRRPAPDIAAVAAAGHLAADAGDTSGAGRDRRRLRTHPQTVRNRIRRLEPLFGPDLYDPASSLDYLMALHTWRLLAAEDERSQGAGA